jgi:transposase
LKFERLPSYSPQLNPMERFCKKLRRRETHDWLFDSLADLKQSIRATLSYFQTVRQKVKPLVEPRRKALAT